MKNYADLGSWYPPRPITFALGDGDTSYNGLGGKVHPKGVHCTFFRLQVYERVAIDFIS